MKGYGCTAAGRSFNRVVLHVTPMFLEVDCKAAHPLQYADLSRLLLRSTRLGSKIVLSKDLNQMLVALGEAYPWKTL